MSAINFPANPIDGESVELSGYRYVFDSMSGTWNRRPIGQSQKEIVTEEGTAQVGLVQTEGDTQVGRVSNEGDAQVSRVSLETGNYYTKTEIDTALADADSFIPGQVILTKASAVTPDFLPLDGSAYYKSAYPELGVMYPDKPPVETVIDLLNYSASADSSQTPEFGYNSSSARALLFDDVEPLWLASAYAKPNGAAGAMIFSIEPGNTASLVGEYPNPMDSVGGDNRPCAVSCDRKYVANPSSGYPLLTVRDVNTGSLVYRRNESSQIVSYNQYGHGVVFAATKPEVLLFGSAPTTADRCIIEIINVETKTILLSDVVSTQSRYASAGFYISGNIKNIAAVTVYSGSNIDDGNNKLRLYDLDNYELIPTPSLIKNSSLNYSNTQSFCIFSPLEDYLCYFPGGSSDGVDYICYLIDTTTFDVVKTIPNPTGARGVNNAAVFLNDTQILFTLDGTDGPRFLYDTQTETTSEYTGDFTGPLSARSGVIYEGHNYSFSDQTLQRTPLVNTDPEFIIDTLASPNTNFEYRIKT